MFDVFGNQFGFEREPLHLLLRLLVLSVFELLLALLLEFIKSGHQILDLILTDGGLSRCRLLSGSNSAHFP